MKYSKLVKKQGYPNDAQEINAFWTFDRNHKVKQPFLKGDLEKEVTFIFVKI